MELTDRSSAAAGLTVALGLIIMLTSAIAGIEAAAQAAELVAPREALVAGSPPEEGRRLAREAQVQGHLTSVAEGLAAAAHVGPRRSLTARVRQVRRGRCR